MSGYPIQPAKVQRPALRDATLARDRLLDWLHAKVHHRVVQVIAEAGYGKTTLLADFSRRTRLRTVWYRLDAEDQSWVAFLSYLVAAAREQVDGFAPATARLLEELGSGGPPLEQVLETLVRELEPLAEGGAVVLFDDFHVVDEAPDVRHIVRTLIHRAPERVSFVFASRRSPSLPIARLRALGEVAELQTDDLRFSTIETEQLFRDTYGRALEPDVLTDLSKRTDGWAASLQLVNSAIQARSAAEIRSFVRSLSGAQGELYDYLAEEVIGTLPEDLQRFLMRVSILAELDPAMMGSATGCDSATVTRLAQEGERCGLLVRTSDPQSSHRAIHPLVRQFLNHRLEREIGTDGLRGLHLAIANAHFDRWSVACHHFAAAQEHAEVRRCLEASVRSILGAGRFALAAGYIRDVPPDELSAPLAMVLSRAAYQTGQEAAAIELAEKAVQLDHSPLTFVNLSSLHFMAGNLAQAVEVGRGAGAIEDPILSQIVDAGSRLLQVGADGSVSDLVDQLREMARDQAQAGMTHYHGVTMLNLAVALRAQGDATGCSEAARHAEQALTDSNSVPECVSATLARAWGDAHLGDIAIALADVDPSNSAGSPELRAEVAAELASIHVWYGDALEAASLLELAPRTGVSPSSNDLVRVARIELAIRRGDTATAHELAEGMHATVLSAEPAHKAHQLAVKARVALEIDAVAAGAQVEEALALSQSQGAWLWFRYVQLAATVLQSRAGDIRLPIFVRLDPAYLSMQAEAVASALGRLNEEDASLVADEAARRPERWRPALRAVVSNAGSSSRMAAAHLLDTVGDASDILLLRNLAGSGPRSALHSLGKSLARRLADRVMVEDQGRVSLHIGSRVVPGSSVRRKVLALLCYLLTRPSFEATRDEVLDALWPDAVPEVSGNSLNQAVYFLRRVLEPAYSERTSAAYIRFEANLLWLDSDLVTSRSSECWKVIKQIGSDPQPNDVLRLTDLYRGRFALDFAYEEWAIPFRESLHAAYLQLVERAVAADVNAGHFDRGTALVRAALTIEPTAENLEVLLVRLYKMSGAHAAAAEQYEHYAGVLRNDLGVEPPDLDSL